MANANGNGETGDRVSGDGLTQASASRRSLMKAAIAGAATGAAGAIGGSRVANAQTASTPAGAQMGDRQRPNIVVIMPDDIGYWNTSAYNMGMMGYRTPNIDRIAQEGAIFTDAYGEQSCTAGRAAFITGQSPLRTGLLTVGMPGEEQGLHADDPTLAELLKPQGYATGQFGKNHLGDRNEHLPTVHGFDEFFGNLYHLNAEEEPENPDYPDNPEFAAKFGPRGVIHSYASDEDDPTEDPRFGAVGKQVIEDTGPLTKERMETIDEEILEGALGFMRQNQEAEQPFFLWFCPTRMHIWTHLKPETEGMTGLGSQADGMVELDGYVGTVLDALEEMGIAENTIVVFATDNGAQVFSWPDGNMTPFKGEKNSNWEGAYRVPMMVRWPGHIEPGTVSNDVVSLQDWVPTLMAAAGVPGIKQRLLVGYESGDKTFTAHLDGYNLLGHLVNGEESPRQEFFYFNDDGELVGLRNGRWKYITRLQTAKGLDVWFEPMDELRRPRLVDLRGDPFERAIEESENYDIWMLERAFLLYPARDIIREFMRTFLAFPPRNAQNQVEKLEGVLDQFRAP